MTGNIWQKWISWFLHFVKYMGPWDVSLCQLCAALSLVWVCLLPGAGMGDVWVSCHFKVTV